MLSSSGGAVVIGIGVGFDHDDSRVLTFHQYVCPVLGSFISFHSIPLFSSGDSGGTKLNAR